MLSCLKQRAQNKRIKIQYKFILLSYKDPKVISPGLVEQHCCPQKASPVLYHKFPRLPLVNSENKSGRTGQKQQAALSSWQNSHTQLQGILGNVVSSWASRYAQLKLL